MALFYKRLTFLAGFFIGLTLSITLSYVVNNYFKLSTLKSYVNQNLVGQYEYWFHNSHFKRVHISFDLLRYTDHRYFLEAEFLYDKVKIGCVILVRNMNNTKAAKATWAQHCNSFFLVNMTNTKSPGLRKENHAWLTMCDRLQKLPSLFHWVLVVTDDTFAIIENIRYLVAGLDSNKQYYLGHPMTFWGVTYNSGQAGYLLSNATLGALKTKYVCTINFTLFNLEDYYLGKALFGLNISTSDTRDELGLSRFHGFNLQKLFFPGSTLLTNYYKFSVYPLKCCSANTVTYKVSASDQMFTYEYLLYQLQIFKSGQYGNIIPTTLTSDDEVWKSFVKERGISDTNNIDAKRYYRLWEDVINKTLIRRL